MHRISSARPPANVLFLVLCNRFDATDRTTPFVMRSTSSKGRKKIAVAATEKMASESITNNKPVPPSRKVAISTLLDIEPKGYIAAVPFKKRNAQISHFSDPFNFAKEKKP
jgi:hypothetical protein